MAKILNNSFRKAGQEPAYDFVTIELESGKIVQGTNDGVTFETAYYTPITPKEAKEIASLGYKRVEYAQEEFKKRDKVFYGC